VLVAAASASVSTHVQVETVNFDEDLLNTEKNIAETFAWKEKESRASDCVKFKTNADGEGYLTIQIGETKHHDQKKMENDDELVECPGGKITTVVVQNTNTDGWVGKVTVVDEDTQAAEGAILKCTENCDQENCLTENLKVDADEKAYKNTTDCMCMGAKKCTLEPTGETKETKAAITEETKTEPTGETKETKTAITEETKTESTGETGKTKTKTKTETKTEPTGETKTETKTTITEEEEKTE